MRHTSYFSGILFLGFGLFILAMALNGSLAYYISPAMRFIVMGGMVVFFVLAITQIWRSTAADKEEGCSCHGGQKGSKGNQQSLLLLMSVLMLGFLLPDYVLSTKMAELKGVAYTFPVSEEMLAVNADFYESYYDGIARSARDERGTLVGEENYMDVLGLLHYQLNAHIGGNIEMSGFVYHDEMTEANEFTVGRFAFTCCAADAVGYGLIVIHTEETIPATGWVKVSGTIQAREYSGQVIPAIQANDIQSIAEPNVPYVYPTLLTK